MNADQLFQLCNTIALLSWIILISTPFWRQFDKFIIGVVITLFCIVYAWLVFKSFHIEDFRSFGTPEGISELFRNKPVLVAGWVHYLAFDLLAGVFIRKNAAIHGIPHWILIPCLLLTFMLGPVGLLLYLLLRWIITRNYFATNVES